MTVEYENCLKLAVTALLWLQKYTLRHASVAIYSGHTWLIAIFTVFHRSLTVSLHSPNGDSERVYPTTWWSNGFRRLAQNISNIAAETVVLRLRFAFSLTKFSLFLHINQGLSVVIKCDFDISITTRTHSANGWHAFSIKAALVIGWCEWVSLIAF